MLVALVATLTACAGEDDIKFGCGTDEDGNTIPCVTSSSHATTTTKTTSFRTWPKVSTTTTSSTSTTTTSTPAPTRETVTVVVPPPAVTITSTPPPRETVTVQPPSPLWDLSQGDKALCPGPKITIDDAGGVLLHTTRVTFHPGGFERAGFSVDKTPDFPVAAVLITFDGTNDTAYTGNLVMSGNQRVTIADFGAHHDFLMGDASEPSGFLFCESEPVVQ